MAPLAAASQLTPAAHDPLHTRAHHRISEVMQWQLHTVAVTCRCDEARRLAEDSGVHQLPVLELGMPAGLVCLCDLTTANDALPVSRFLQVPVLSLPLASQDEDAALLVRKWQALCLHVMYRGFLVGLVTAGDLVRAGALSPADRPHCHGMRALGQRDSGGTP